MFKEFKHWFTKNGLVAGSVSVLAISVVVFAIISTNESLSKYVLDTVVYEINQRAAEHLTITAIGPLLGTPEVGRTLKAGPVTPEHATVDYQWQRSYDGESFTDIPGAKSDTYTVTAEDFNSYLRVVARGTGVFTGEVASGPSVVVAPGVLIGISEIIGSTRIGETLTAGTVTPYGATVLYQWQRSQDGENWTGIDGATSNTYTLAGPDIGYYIRVAAIGTGAYTGTVFSMPTTDPVKSGGTTQITGIGVISGTPRVGQTLTAGTIYPIGATATYQWQRSADGEQWDDIPGATSKSYLLVPDDYQYYIRVVATGSGNFIGVVQSGLVGPVIATQITGIGVISGTVREGEMLTAGTITPIGATVTYHWQKSATPLGTYVDIPGATSPSYRLTNADVGCFIRVMAEGTGSYYGTVTSIYVGPVQEKSIPVIPIEGIDPITGTLQIGSTVFAGALTPSHATATYRWQRCSSPDGIFENIPGATGSIYTLGPEDHNMFIRVVATGLGLFSGTVESPAEGPVMPAPLIAIGEISGTTVIGEELTAGTVMPYGATVTYQWQRSDTGLEGFWQNIPGAVSRTYTIVGQDSYCYIRVVVTGTGAYTGTVVSAPTKGRVSPAATSVTAIGEILGMPRVGSMLTAGQLTPPDATATYQWQKSVSPDGPYEDIPYATERTYVVSPDDFGCYIRVVAIGSGLYKGSVTSEPTAPVAESLLKGIGLIMGISRPGETLTAGVLQPEGATATYQWQRCDSPNGVYEDIPGAVLGIYTITADDVGYYIRVVATGSGGYTGTVASTPIGPVFTSDVIALNGIGPIAGTPRVGETLTAGPADPPDATVTYHWQRCETEDGSYENIPGAVSGSYTLTADDWDKFIRVVAVGTGRYTGTAASAPAGKVASAPITAISDIVGTAGLGKTLTAGTVFPLGATVTYQWQKADAWNITGYVDIPGATSPSFTPHGELSGLYLRVKVTGTGAYTGTVFSPRTQGRIGINFTSITSIEPVTGIPRAGKTLTAGDTMPYGASVTYQWQRSEDGVIYENIPGAVYQTYTLQPSDYGCYIRVVAVGAGKYIGTVSSEAIGPVQGAVISRVSPIRGTTSVGSVIAAGVPDPFDATVTYRWQRSDTPEGSFEDIPGASSSTYLLTGDDEGYYVRVVTEGTGSYSGEISSEPVGPVFAGDPIVLEAAGPVEGTAQVGSVLTAGALSPDGATATYQWQRSGDGISYQDIPGAVYSSYTPGPGDYDCCIRVIATGSGQYSGSVVSEATDKVGPAPITGVSGIVGNVCVDQTLAAGTVFPLGATVTYQWQVSDDWQGISYTDLPGATSMFYAVDGLDHAAKFLRVVITGTGAYTGTVISEPTAARIGSQNIQLTSIESITGTVEAGSTLTAGVLSPSGAKASYQWQKSEDLNYWEDIPGAVFSTYELQPEDEGCYIRVVATGSGEYRGKLTGDPVGPVQTSSGVQALNLDPLYAAILEAMAAKEGVAIRGDGQDVPADTYWVTQGDMEALDEAIAAVQDALDLVKTQEDVENIIAYLKAAIAVFNEAKQQGTAVKAIGAPVDAADPEKSSGEGDKGSDDAICGGDGEDDEKNDGTGEETTEEPTDKEDDADKQDDRIDEGVEDPVDKEHSSHDRDETPHGDPDAHGNSAQGNGEGVPGH